MSDTTAPVTETEPPLDPDCRDGKHGSCTGGPCGCACHDQCTEGKYGDYGPQCQLEAAHHQRGEPCKWAPAGPGEAKEGCEHCGGTGVVPGSEDYDPAVHAYNPTTGEPCDCVLRSES